MVTQDLKTLMRHWEAYVDAGGFEELFRRRAEGEDIKIAKAMEANFYDPQNDVEARIKGHIDRYNAQLIKKCEAELFVQKKRLADAERGLSAKETKKALSDQRIATNKIEWNLQKLKSVQRTELKPSDSRIFPFWFAPVFIFEDGKYVIRPMRYHCRPNGKPEWYDKKYDGLYNARRDNLEGFWKRLFGKNHGFFVATSFFENVKLHDYEKRALRQDEKPTNLVLHFNPQPTAPMFLVCLWDRWQSPGKADLLSFSAITDEPPVEVAATGHDRCVIPLQSKNIDAWMNPGEKNTADLYGLLDDRERPYFENQLAA
jgi:putative SOS response-associated peptidase YedK